MDIISAYREVGTYRGAAEICATTHKTVRRVIERAEAGDARPVPAARVRNYESVADVVAARVAASNGRISAKRLLPVAAAAGYGGSERNFRRLVAAQKLSWRRDHHRGRRPAVWEPGGFLVFDWATVGAGLHLFCAVLAWSRWRFVAVADQAADRPDGLPQGRCRSQCGGADTGLRAVRRALRVQPGLLPRPGPKRSQRGRGIRGVEDVSHPAVPQDRHVIDAVRPGHHPRDQGGYLQTRVRALVGGHGQELIGQRPQTHHRSEFHDWDQASRRHQVWFVEHR